MNKSTVIKKPKTIAVYSANFGNYRNELKTGIDNVHFDKNIDYYFFTDNKEIKSNKWKVILINLQPNLNFLNSYRHTSKHIKFIVPQILKKYDIIMWIDTKCLNNIKFSKDKIIKFTEKQNNKSMFFMKHFCRKTAQEEIKVTTKLNLESKVNGAKFLNKINNMKFNTHLPDTQCIVYNRTVNNISLLKKIYDTLIAEGLRRDQNVIQYVLLKNNYESNVSYFIFNDLYK